MIGRNEGEENGGKVARVGEYKEGHERGGEAVELQQSREIGSSHMSVLY